MRRLTPDSSQRQIIDIHGSRALVLAGPGCGKTHLLTRRIIHAHADLGIPFADMICLTFTNRASREMNSRILDELGSMPQGLFVGNLHRFCSRFLHDNRLLGHDTSLLDEDDRDTWLADSLGIRRKFELKQTVDLAMLHSQRAADFPDPLLRRLDFIPSPAHIRAAEAYREYKSANHLIDFDDLMLLTYRALSSHRRGSLLYSSYRWLQVDEVQDLTPLQLAIIDLISADGPSTAVYLGDEQQAIFEFIGAGGPALDKLKQRCSDNIYRLARNYRSPAYLVSLCNDFAAACLGISRDLLPEAADSSQRPAGAMQLLPATDCNLTNAVAAKVRQWTDAEPSCRIAVLTRTNDLAEDISALLTAHGIDNTLVSRNDLFRRVAFKTVYAHLAVVADPNRTAEWARLLYQTGAVATHTEARGLVGRLRDLGLTPVTLLIDDAMPEDARDCARDFVASPVVRRIAQKFRTNYGPLYSHTTAMLSATEPGDDNTLAAEMNHAYTYLNSHGYISAIGRWPAVVTFVGRTFAGSRPDTTFASQLFSRLSELRTFNEGDLLTDERVTVITVHKAKGLEFDNVIICDVARHPAGRGGDDSRVYYVAFSRARQRLAVFHTGHPSTPVATVIRHFDLISPDEVEAMSLLERLHSLPAPPRQRR